MSSLFLFGFAFEIVLIAILAYGFFHEDQFIAWENSVKDYLRGLKK